MKTITYNAGQVIFKQGAFEHTMYDVVSGRVGICVDHQTDREKQIAELGSEEIFGEMGLIEAYPRFATAVALEDHTVLSEIEESELMDYFRDKPEKSFKLLKLLSQRIRETDEKYFDVCRVIYEMSEAEKNNQERSEKLNKELDYFSKEFGNVNTFWLD